MADLKVTNYPLGEWSDRELLDRFTFSNDELAFAELVVRYAPQVLSVCRRVLPRSHDADDAFQATFFLLARHAARIRKRTSVGAWLYGVAYRTALRAARRERKRREVPEVETPDGYDVLEDIARRHERRLLDEELDRLPRKYREPLVLHYLFGKSRREVARELRLTTTIVKGRLQRGRNELRVRLALRGVGFAVLLAVANRSSSPLAAETIDLLLAAARRGADAAAANPNNLSGHTVGATLQTGNGTMALWMSTTTACVIATIGIGLPSAWTGGVLPRPNVAEPILPEQVVKLDTSLLLDAVEAPDVSAAPVIFASPLFAAAVPAADRSDSKDPPKSTQKSPQADPETDTVKYHDKTPDGKKSLAGSGEMIRFKLPAAGAKVRGVRIHGSRCGTPQPPKEEFAVHFVSDDESKSLHTEKAPYSRFTRGEPRWVTLDFKKPLDLPEDFWVVLDFNAERTKGVYVSYDTSSGGEHSRVGLPDKESKAVDFGGDWMVELLLAK